MVYRPRLRPVDAQPFDQDGRVMIYLRDPLSLSANMVAVPEELGPVLALADGTRDLYAIQAGLLARFGMSIRLKTLEQVFAALDEVCLLENERAADAKRAALEAFRAAPYRPPALAGSGYPETLDGLKTALDEYIVRAKGLRRDGSHDSKAADHRPLRGIVSPHIDYQRGAPVYGAVWGRTDVMEAARAAELVIALGTDHSGGFGKVTLTRQSYATPYGVLPTPAGLVEELAGLLGEDGAFEEELHHRNEHSIELALNWLHHVRRGAEVEVLPVLCGSFHHFSHGGADPAEHVAFDAAVQVLRRAMQERRTLVVAAADLAHIGPAFGGEAVDAGMQAKLRAADDGILRQMHVGDAAGFFDELRGVEDANNVCGLPPIYLALRLLTPVTGETIAYDQCSADDSDTSWVSVAGVAWR
jgi:MEMO1 family protein